MADGFGSFQHSWVIGESFHFLKQFFQFPNLVLNPIWSGTIEILMKVSVPCLKQLPSCLILGEEELCDVIKEEKSWHLNWEVEVFSGFSVLSFPSSVWKEYLSFIK
jgi:hypothetical protein